MKSHKNLLCSLFLLSLLCFLAAGTILLATVSSLSGPGRALVLLLLSLAEAGGLAALGYRVFFPSGAPPSCCPGSSAPGWRTSRSPTSSICSANPTLKNTRT